MSSNAFSGITCIVCCWFKHMIKTKSVKLRTLNTDCKTMQRCALGLVCLQVPQLIWLLLHLLLNSLFGSESHFPEE